MVRFIFNSIHGAGLMNGREDIENGGCGRDLKKGEMMKMTRACGFCFRLLCVCASVCINDKT